MDRSDNAHDHVDHGDRDSRNDPRTRPQPDGEIVVNRTPIIADGRREAEQERSVIPGDRRRSERRRIERMGTDI